MRGYRGDLVTLVREDLFEWLRLFRNRARLSITDVALASGLSRQEVAGTEAGGVLDAAIMLKLLPVYQIPQAVLSAKLQDISRRFG